jgi:hypothetical protein
MLGNEGMPSSNYDQEEESDDDDDTPPGRHALLVLVATLALAVLLAFHWRKKMLVA